MKRTRIVKLRVSEAEYKFLLSKGKRAGGMSELIRQRVLSGDVSTTPRDSIRELAAIRATLQIIARSTSTVSSIDALRLTMQLIQIEHQATEIAERLLKS